jgi:hypothetical protein
VLSSLSLANESELQKGWQGNFASREWSRLPDSPPNCFRLGEEKALDRITELEADRAAVQGLPLGSFISYNRLSGASLQGRVF